MNYTPESLKRHINRHCHSGNRVSVSHGVFGSGIGVFEMMFGKDARKDVFRFLFEVESSKEMSIEQKFGFSEWIATRLAPIHSETNPFATTWKPRDGFREEAEMVIKYLESIKPSKDSDDSGLSDDSNDSDYQDDSMLPCFG
jgi:hypothetical protein